jgi:PAS domain S-box-containing protein
MLPHRDIRAHNCQARSEKGQGVPERQRAPDSSALTPPGRAGPKTAINRLGIDLHSLSAQMIAGFVALVLLTAVAAGLPAIWLIHDQLTRQAWAQVEQGRRAAQALYEAKKSELEDLATLTSQRPTLRALLATEDQAALTTYLRTLQAGAGLDLALVCDLEQRPIVQTEELLAATLCASDAQSGFHVVGGNLAPQVWLLAAHPIVDGADAEDRPLSDTQMERDGLLVIVGMALDNAFAAQMRDQSGLEHTLIVGGQPTATSLGGGLASLASRRAAQPETTADRLRFTFSLDGDPFYADRLSLRGLGSGERGSPDPAEYAGLEAELALPVSDIVATQRRLAWMLAGGVLVVAVVGSGAGAFLARRIGQPLARLTNAAAELSKGELSRPVVIEARVREVTLVAQALENARTDLQQTLNRLRQEKAWTDHLLEAIVEGIMTLDRHGRITFFSHGAERITGWQRDHVLGRTCDQVFQTLETDEAFSELLPPPGRRHKISVALRDGRQAILSFTGAQLAPPSGGDGHVALVFRDVSEEEAIHRLLGHFLANVAHEFRTPLAAAAASVELLLDQAPDLSLAELGELLTSLHLGVLGLQTLVDNLLESASIEAGHFRVAPRPSDLSEIIADAIRMTQPLLDKRGQRLTVELPAAIPIVQADPRRTVQVLVNLLSNASKYGPDQAEIGIGATVNADWVKVIVVDQGPGIPSEQRKDLFRRFVRLHTANDQAQYGAGLGLSVVKAVIEAHGGQVGVDDRPDGGSIFWLTLPRGSKG